MSRFAAFDVADSTCDCLNVNAHSMFFADGPTGTRATNESMTPGCQKRSDWLENLHASEM